MATGSTLSGAYDEQMVRRFMEEQEKQKTETKPTKEEMKVIKQKVKPTDKEQLFSSVFWKPKHIPDIPIRVWQVEDWAPEAQIMIPSINPHWVWPKEATELFAVAMYFNDTTLIHGLQGTGKSDLPAQWCAKFNIPMWRMSCHSEIREVHFVGSPGVEYHIGEDGKAHPTIVQEPTLLTDSLKYGGFFVEDEAFRHSSALVLQSLREKNTRTLILPDAPGRSAKERILKASQDKWRYILTDNTPGGGDSFGIFQAEVQDASTLDRITACIEVDYLPKAEEIKILKNYTKGLNAACIENMVTFANIVRNSFRDGSIMTTFSVRALLAWAEKTEVLGSVKDGLRLSWFSKLGQDNDKAKAADIYHQVFAEKI